MISQKEADATLFDGFLKVRRVGNLLNLNGPGHNCAMVGTIGLEQDGTPHIILKKGDTRLSRQLRGDSYVKLGPTGGRLDKVGAGPDKIGLGETAEELGGTPVEGSFRRLGGKLSPTMPNESTECDAYFSAIVQLGGQIEGDGGGMEAVGLIGPYVCDYPEFQKLLTAGDIAEAGRTRTVYARTFDSIGYVPQLNVYVHDHPELKKRFSTLGLGEPWDPRKGKHRPHPEPDPHQPKTDANRIDRALVLEQEVVDCGDGLKMVNATTVHAAGDKRVGQPFVNQVMTYPYDRAKMVIYRNDPARGPLVQWTSQERPLIAAKATCFAGECDPALDNTQASRMDVTDVKIHNLDERLDGVQLCRPTSASSGQADLYYQFWAKEDPSVEGVPIAQALEACRRDGQGDAQTEAALLMLCERLKWIPQLGMSADEAGKWVRSR